MSNASEQRLVLPAMPVGLAALDAQRKVLTSQSINDRVEHIFRTLYDTAPEFLALISAATNDEAVEGSVACDDFSAASQLRSLARKLGDTVVSDASLAAVTKSLKVVLRRYNLSREGRLERAIPIAAAADNSD